jgi:cell division septum initiation protein DivIVA
MRPTSVELLEGIAQALEDQVLPLMQDKWGASTLRSAMQLLRHLALRVPFEARFLAADNEDVRRVLTLVHDQLTQIGESDLASSAAAALGARAADPLDVIATDAQNETYLRAVEAIVAARDRLRARGAPPQIHAALVEYLQRRLERERGMFLPVFLSPPF